MGSSNFRVLKQSAFWDVFFPTGRVVRTWINGARFLVTLQSLLQDNLPADARDWNNVPVTRDQIALNATWDLPTARGLYAVCAALGIPAVLLGALQAEATARSLTHVTADPIQRALTPTVSTSIILAVWLWHFALAHASAGVSEVDPYWIRFPLDTIYPAWGVRVAIPTTGSDEGSISEVLREDLPDASGPLPGDVSPGDPTPAPTPTATPDTRPIRHLDVPETNIIGYQYDTTGRPTTQAPSGVGGATVAVGLVVIATLVGVVLVKTGDSLVKTRGRSKAE